MLVTINFIALITTLFCGATAILEEEIIFDSKKQVTLLNTKLRKAVATTLVAAPIVWSVTFVMLIEYSTWSTILTIVSYLIAFALVYNLAYTMKCRRSVELGTLKPSFKDKTLFDRETTFVLVATSAILQMLSLAIKMWLV